jgi:hypothetical protein
MRYVPAGDGPVAKTQQPKLKPKKKARAMFSNARRPFGPVVGAFVV